jgi:hypothetical protein
MDLMVDYFRCTDALPRFAVADGRCEQPGYFRFGHDTIGFGRACVDVPVSRAGMHLADLLAAVEIHDMECVLQFDANEVVDNLRKERYAEYAQPHSRLRNAYKIAYYLARPLLPFSLRGYLKRMLLNRRQTRPFPEWPVDRTVDRIFENLMLLAMKTSGIDRMPFIWFWPEGYSGCAVMTHDVETRAGVEFCGPLMELDDSLGIKASFQIIPEGRYMMPQPLIAEMTSRGFEVNVHDWNHDGMLFSTKACFSERANKINQAADNLGARGFRAGALYRNTDWYDAFTFSYDMSVPNVGHLDPQWGGCCTVMPYSIGRILEIPVTTTQDYMLFHMLGEYSTELWEKQIDLILEGNGLASFIVHPDYIIEKHARAVYTQLLEHLSRIRSERNVWMARPGEVNRWWRNRSQMKLVRSGSQWAIEGSGSEEACVAYAILDGSHLAYRVETKVPSEQLLPI